MKNEKREIVAIEAAINQCTADMNMAVYHLKEAVCKTVDIPLEKWQDINTHSGKQYVCPFKIVGNKLAPKNDKENIKEYNELSFNKCFVKAEEYLIKQLEGIKSDIKSLKVNIVALKEIKQAIINAKRRAEDVPPLQESALLSKGPEAVFNSFYPTLENLVDAEITNQFDIHQAEGLLVRLKQEKTLLKWRIEQVHTRRKCWLVRDRLLGVFSEIKASSLPSLSSPPSTPSTLSKSPINGDDPFVSIGSYPLFAGREIETPKSNPSFKRFITRDSPGSDVKRTKLEYGSSSRTGRAPSIEVDKLKGNDGNLLFLYQSPEWTWVKPNKDNLVNAKLEKESPKKLFAYLKYKDRHALALVKQPNPMSAIKEVCLLGYCSNGQIALSLLKRIEDWEISIEGDIFDKLYDEFSSSE